MKYKFKVGDRVIGNELADKKYCITKKGWVGIVTKVNDTNFKAKSIYNDDSDEFWLSYNCFDRINFEKIISFQLTVYLRALLLI